MIEMSKSDNRELESRLAVLIEHLLKIKYVKGRVLADNIRGWQKSVDIQRIEILDQLDDHPALKHLLNDRTLDNIYRSVVDRIEDAYPHATFPRNRQLSSADILGRHI
jgi:hypothetical protein